MPTPMFCLATAARVDAVEQGYPLATKKPLRSIAGSLGQRVTQRILTKGDLVHQGLDKLKRVPRRIPLVLERVVGDGDVHPVDPVDQAVLLAHLQPRDHAIGDLPTVQAIVACQCSSCRIDL